MASVIDAIRDACVKSKNDHIRLDGKNWIEHNRNGNIGIVSLKKISNGKETFTVCDKVIVTKDKEKYHKCLEFYNKKRIPHKCNIMEFISNIPLSNVTTMLVNGKLNSSKLINTAYCKQCGQTFVCSHLDMRQTQKVVARLRPS
ncbi:hypothetical protein M0R19_07555 [Candidatus Pacearchaeota archaeon]|jgi:hypothetical protein|nr:hypothetical protein [bacterium]MCK9597017.1 hypothetical protein [Candidatus Pacearchaeota archaeon]